MRPTIIPEQLIPEGYRRIVLSAPNGDLTDPDVAPVEVLVGPLGTHTSFRLRCQLEPGDLERLAAGSHIWLTFVGQVPVLSMSVGP